MDSILLSGLALIILYLLLKPKRRRKDISYIQFRIDRENDQKKIQQEIDDKKLERDAKAEALDMFNQWVSGQLIVVRKPIIKFIMNHYPYESKYRSEDLDEIRKNELTRLQNQYEKKYGTHRNGGLFDYRKWQG